MKKSELKQLIKEVLEEKNNLKRSFEEKVKKIDVKLLYIQEEFTRIMEMMKNDRSK